MKWNTTVQNILKASTQRTYPVCTSKKKLLRQQRSRRRPMKVEEEECVQRSRENIENVINATLRTFCRSLIILMAFCRGNLHAGSGLVEAWMVSSLSLSMIAISFTLLCAVCNSGKSTCAGARESADEVDKLVTRRWIFFECELCNLSNVGDLVDKRLRERMVPKHIWEFNLSRSLACPFKKFTHSLHIVWVSLLFFAT